MFTFYITTRNLVLWFWIIFESLKIPEIKIFYMSFINYHKLSNFIKTYVNKNLL